MNLNRSRSSISSISNAAGARRWFDTEMIETSISYQQNENHDPTNTCIQITSPGEPQVQSRPRIVNRGIFDPQRAFKTEFRRRIQSDLERHGIHHFPIFSSGTNLRVTVTFHVFRMTKDIDNLLKLILDVLNGAVYSNDADVTMVVAQKRKAQSNSSDHAYTFLTIEEHTIN